MKVLEGGKSFRGSCRSCTATTWMVQVVKQDGSIGWHPFDEHDGGPSFTSHFDTCPAAKKWRNGRRPPEANPQPTHACAWRTTGRLLLGDGSLGTKQTCTVPGCGRTRNLDAQGGVVL